MRPAILLLFLFSSLSVKAQVIGDEALQKIQSGNVSFLEGEFIVFFEDTVSESFIQKEFDKLGYEISYSDIKPILISVVNTPADTVLKQLENHPEVVRSFSEHSPVDSSYFEGLLKEQGLTGEDFDQAFERLVNSQTNKIRFIEFDYSVNENRLKEIMGTFRSVAYQIHQNFPRSVNVTCEPEREEELMKKIEELPYVESTALIGVIGE